MARGFLSQLPGPVGLRTQERVQKRRLQPAINPEAAAAAKKAKNRRRADGKKRKLEAGGLNPLRNGIQATCA